MSKIEFKRKRSGKGSGWGVGLDYLLKENWDDLDLLTKNNYFGKHDPELIDKLLLKSASALKSAKKLMVDSKDWLGKAQNILNLENAKTPEEKVVFIDSVVQFLRETYIGNNNKIQKINDGLGKLKRENTSSNKHNLRGIPAWKFESVRGKIRVIKNEKQFSKFKEGEILVTEETDPSFLPLMKKARAIITENGGILCHAAIVSRELRKPCIVGTKLATQFSKTGDVVEVDGNNGIIRKIKQ